MSRDTFYWWLRIVGCQLNACLLIWHLSSDLFTSFYASLLLGGLMAWSDRPKVIR